LVFGVVSLISIWINVCQSEPHLVDVLAYSTVTAFMSECSKFGLFLLTDLCRSPDYWYSNESNEFSGSKSCEIDRGAFMSIGSICAYLVSMVLAVGFAARPNGDYFAHDEASLPSWMATEHGADAETHTISTVVSNKDKERHHHPGSVSYTRPSSDVAPTIANQSSNSPNARRPPNRRITQPTASASRSTSERFRQSLSSQSQRDRPHRRLVQSAVLERPRRSRRSTEQSNVLERPDRALLQPFNPSHLAALERHRRRSMQSTDQSNVPERANTSRRLPQPFNPSRIERPNRRLTQSTEQSSNSQVEDYSRHRRSAPSTTRSPVRSNVVGANGSYIVEDYGMHPGHLNNVPCNIAPIEDYTITNEDYGMETMEEYDMVNVPLPKEEEYMSPMQACQDEEYMDPMQICREEEYMDPMQICREEEHMDPMQVCREEEYPHPALEFPPTENARRTYDECSEMTWDAGY